MSVIFPYSIALAFFISAIAQKCVERKIDDSIRSKEKAFAERSSWLCMILAVISALLFLLF